MDVVIYVEEDLYNFKARESYTLDVIKIEESISMEEVEITYREGDEKRVIIIPKSWVIALMFKDC